MKSAFSDKVRCSDDYFTVDAPEYHSAAYVTGGISSLYHMIKHDAVPALPEIGYHTDSNGHFDPKGKCLLGLRYNVIKILDAKGQSAVLVEAEDQFCSNRRVVIKVLHSHYYQLGGQETHVLKKLAVADSHNYSHTLRLLTTLTMDTHYCMVFEPMLPDPLTHFFNYIPSHKKLGDIRRVGLRLLTSISFLHQQNLIHTDLKPENILLKHEQDLDSVHIVDFGNAINFVHSEVSLYYKDFDLQTPLYRAPEVMYGIPFGPEIDIWSLGCILAELYLGKPLFLGTTQDQILKQMHKLLGSFPTKLFRRGKYYPTLRKFTGDDVQDVSTFKLMEFMQCSDHNFADLISGMLRYNPEERLTASQAATHPFFASHIPLAFLLHSSQGGCPYSAVSLTKDTYRFSPYIPPSIRRQPLSSIDLLKQGTVENSNLTKFVMKPSPKISRLRGNNSSAATSGGSSYVASGGDNLSEKSGFKKPVSESRGENKHTVQGVSDVSVVRKFIVGAKKGEKYSENVKDKMSSLLRAIRDEQTSVEDDLDRRIEAQGTHNAKNRSKTNIPSVIKMQRPCPRYGKLGQSHQDINTVQDSNPRKHTLSQTTYREVNNECLGSIDADTCKDNNPGIACRSSVGSQKTLVSVKPSRQSVDGLPRRHNVLPMRYEESRTVPYSQNSDSDSYEEDGASPSSTSYCSTNDVAMETGNISCDKFTVQSGIEDQSDDNVDRRKLKNQVNMKRKLHSLARSTAELPKVGKFSPSVEVGKFSPSVKVGQFSPGDQISRQMNDKGRHTRRSVEIIHSHKKDLLYTKSDERFQIEQKPDLNSLHLARNTKSATKTDHFHRRVNERKPVSHTSDVDVSTIPIDQSPQRLNRKRAASVSVSDEEEYLDLLSTPSMVKSERKKVKSGSLTKRRQTHENDRNCLESVTKSATLKTVSPQTGFGESSNSSRKHDHRDELFEDIYSNVCDDKARQIGQSKSRLCNTDRSMMATNSDLKPSARFYGDNSPQDVPVFTPIQKINPVVTNLSDSPEIIYKCAHTQDSHKKSTRRDEKNSFSYHGSVNKKSLKTERKFMVSQKCSKDIRKSLPDHRKSLPDNMKSERNEQVRYVDRTDVRTLSQDDICEDSHHSDFSFRGTPNTDGKHCNRVGGIAERIAQINEKRKKPARKSLKFQYCDQHHEEQRNENRYNDYTGRNQFNSEGIHATHDFSNENNELRDKYEKRTTYNHDKETRMSNFHQGDQTGELHDRVTNAGNNHKSERDIKPLYRQRWSVNSKLEKTNLRRKYIPKNDTTFTIDYESPKHENY